MRTLAPVWLAVVVSFGCGVQPPPPGTQPPTFTPQALPTRSAKVPVGVPIASAVTATIGAAGGTLATGDGQLTVVVPAGAVPDGTMLSATPISNTVPGGFGAAYRLSKPPGVEFAQPVTVKLRYELSDLEGRSASTFQIARQVADGRWEALPTTLDLPTRTLTVTTRTFSDWAKYSGYQLLPLTSVVKTGHSVAFGLRICQAKNYADPGEEPLIGIGIGECVFPNNKEVPRTWAVNGDPGGNATLGIIPADGPFQVLYRAPATVPSPETVEVSLELLEEPPQGKTLLISRVRIEEFDGYLGALRIEGSSVSGGTTTTLRAVGKLTFARTRNEEDFEDFRLEAARADLTLLAWSAVSASKSCVYQDGPVTIGSVSGDVSLYKEQRTYRFGGLVSLVIPAACTYPGGRTGMETFRGLTFAYGNAMGANEAYAEPSLLSKSAFLFQGSGPQGTVSWFQDWTLSRGDP